MIPKEIDELMWLVAESTDPTAIEDFQNRYPTYQGELIKRIRAVRALKEAGKAPVSQPPVFVKPASPIKPFRWWAAGVAFAALSVVAFGAWRMMPPSYDHQTSGANNPGPVINTQHVRGPDQSPNDTRTQFTNEESQSANNAMPQAPVQQKPVEDEMPFYPEDSRTSVTLEMAPLHAAIHAIAASGNYTVTIAAGTPNPEVKVNFENMTPFEMLKQLGDEYAFVPVIDGQNAILIIPKRDDIPQAGQNGVETR